MRCEWQSSSFPLRLDCEFPSLFFNFVVDLQVEITKCREKIRFSVSHTLDLQLVKHTQNMKKRMESELRSFFSIRKKVTNLRERIRWRRKAADRKQRQEDRDENKSSFEISLRRREEIL